MTQTLSVGFENVPPFPPLSPDAMRYTMFRDKASGQTYRFLFWANGCLEMRATGSSHSFKISPPTFEREMEAFDSDAQAWPSDLRREG